MHTSRMSGSFHGIAEAGSLFQTLANLQYTRLKPRLLGRVVVYPVGSARQEVRRRLNAGDESPAPPLFAGPRASETKQIWRFRPPDHDRSAAAGR